MFRSVAFDARHGGYENEEFRPVLTTAKRGARLEKKKRLNGPGGTQKEEKELKTSRGQIERGRIHLKFTIYPFIFFVPPVSLLVPVQSSCHFWRI